jgi:hypothetical protein
LDNLTTPFRAERPRGADIPRCRLAKTLSTVVSLPRQAALKLRNKEEQSSKRVPRLFSRYLLRPSPPVSNLPFRCWCLAGIFFFAGLGLYTRHNDFPCYYHPDEPTKARQLITERFNFNHPLLLLQATRLFRGAAGGAPTMQPVTETGRWVSAAFAAGAIACLSLLAAHLYGTMAAACTGVLLLGSSHLYELAHYMKEDTALAFGIAAFFLTLTRSWLRPTPARFALLGAAAALAVSAKYIGVLVLPLAGAPIFWFPENSRRNAFIVGAVCGLALLAINFPMLGSLTEFSEHLQREVDFTIHGHKGLTRSVPHGVYTAVFTGATNPVIWILLGFYYARLLGYRKTIHPAEWVLAVFPILYVLILSFSPKTHHRYFLPDTLLFCTLAVFGLFCFRLPGPALLTRAIQVVAFLAAAGIFGARLVSADSAFTQDTRKQLIAFVRQNVPGDAMIAQDRRVNLPTRTDPRHADASGFLEQTVVDDAAALQGGGLEELRAQGIRYVAVSEGDYGRFFLKTHKPAAEETDYARKKAFYERLFREGQLLWQCPAGVFPYLQPELRLYQLP